MRPSRQIGTAAVLAFWAVALAALPRAAELDNCRRSSLGEPERAPDREWGGSIERWYLDLDGDGIDDEIVARQSSGSGFGMRQATATLSGDGRSVEATWHYSFYAMTDPNPVPTELLAPGAEGLRVALEDALFGVLCDRPDPSLARLLGGKGIQWIEGPAALPDGYTLFARASDTEPARWVHYSGQLHRNAFPFGSDPVTYPLEVDRDDRHRLWLTGHGAFLTDLDSRRHAWLWILPGHPNHKMRWRSMADGRLEGETAVLEVEIRGGLDQRGIVRVDVITGEVEETWEPPPDELPD